MIEIYNKETGKKIGELSESHFDFLMDNIENEYLEEINYIIDTDVISVLKERGADKKILNLLKDAIKGKKSVSILPVIPEDAEFDYDVEEEEEEEEEEL